MKQVLCFVLKWTHFHFLRQFRFIPNILTKSEHFSITKTNIIQLVCISHQTALMSADNSCSFAQTTAVLSTVHRSVKFHPKRCLFFMSLQRFLITPFTQWLLYISILATAVFYIFTGNTFFNFFYTTNVSYFCCFSVLFS